jgi:hypothetical protein
LQLLQGSTADDLGVEPPELIALVNMSYRSYAVPESCSPNLNPLYMASVFTGNCEDREGYVIKMQQVEYNKAMY